MWAFFVGLGLAIALTVASAVVYTAGDVTVVERSSPADSVRIEDSASKTAARTGYGRENTPRGAI